MSNNWLCSVRMWPSVRSMSTGVGWQVGIFFWLLGMTCWWQAGWHLFWLVGTLASFCLVGIFFVWLARWWQGGSKLDQLPPLSSADSENPSEASTAWEASALSRTAMRNFFLFLSFEFFNRRICHAKLSKVPRPSLSSQLENQQNCESVKLCIACSSPVHLAMWHSLLTNSNRNRLCH